MAAEVGVRCRTVQAPDRRKSTEISLGAAGKLVEGSVDRWLAFDISCRAGKHMVW